jgi:hypothetical protein
MTAVSGRWELVFIIGVYYAPPKLKTESLD